MHVEGAATEGDDDIENWLAAACDGWEPPTGDLDPTDVEGDDSEPSLSPAELKEARVDLAAWRSPKDFRKVVRRLHKRSRSRDFKKPGPKFLLDAWTLAEFVGHLPVNEVRLAAQSEQWPDGYVKIGSRVENVEVTIALMPGRRMWDEYQFETKAELDPVANWIERANAIPEALEKAITAKLAKRYGEKMWLVVYLNINEYGIRQAETKQAIADIKRRYLKSLGGLFVLWKEKVI